MVAASCTPQKKNREIANSFSPGKVKKAIKIAPITIRMAFVNIKDESNPNLSMKNPIK